ncbi:hypothetical protein [Pseudomonas parafulva]|uniref:Uncharacterized protein n=1 Tax=Pseudomonas parafulva TaxID=157782 RepID=A0AAJ0LIW7_9PSED|nr:hypothetical protein [Pseudomonas parafulva]KTT16893.1 hypothetical protein NS96R_14165 [Pseudomonas parafulva]
MTVKINRDSGANPRPLIESLVKGQSYPFVATLKHSNTFPLVVPSAGVTGVIQRDEPTPVRIRSFDQAWNLIVDLAELAKLASGAGGESAEGPPAFAELETSASTKAKNRRAAATDEPAQTTAPEGV